MIEQTLVETVLEDGGNERRTEMLKHIKRPCSVEQKTKRQYQGRIVFILTIQFDLKYKEITLARGLASVQNKREINVKGLANQLKLTS